MARPRDCGERALDLVEGGGRPVLYVPCVDAEMSAFVPTAKHTRYPHKGEAGATDANAAWSYETPPDAVGAIRGHCAFHTHLVRIEV